MSEESAGKRPIDLVFLASAVQTQYTDKVGKRSPWYVRMNITGENLAELPAEFTEAQVFSVMEFARKFELIAFNVGIGHGKRLAGEVYNPTVAELKRRLTAAIAENERLADVLEKFTSKEP